MRLVSVLLPNLLVNDYDCPHHRLNTILILPVFVKTPFHARESLAPRLELLLGYSRILNLLKLAHLKYAMRHVFRIAI